MNREINIGIIGAGNIVESIHLPILLNIPGVNIKWIFDKDEKRSTLLSGMYSVDYITGDKLDEGIEEADLCLIAIPYGVRDAYIHKCAAYAKAVYIEKPFATTVAEHQAYCELFAPPDLAIGFQRRYYKCVNELQHIISGSLFGKVQAIYFNQGYFQLKGGTGFMSDARMSGGGVIIESAIHTLDQILQFTKASALNVEEVHSLSKSGIDYDTKFTSTLSYDGASFPVYSHVSSLRNLDNGIIIEFENKVVRLQPAANAVLYVKDANDKKFIELILPESEPGPRSTSVNDAFVRFWEDFINAIHSRQSNQTNAVNSMLTSTWIEKIYQQINQPKT